jgi:hypothetical protein
MADCLTRIEKGTLSYNGKTTAADHCRTTVVKFAGTTGKMD